MTPYRRFLGVLSIVNVVLVNASIGVESSTLPIIDLGYASYQGAIVHDEINNATRTQFLSIRYAAPPTGSARFRQPAPPNIALGIQQADSEPPTCMQNGGFGFAPASPFRNGQATLSKRREQYTHQARAATNMSEDCLFLNVYIPGTLGQKKNLPVVFWIHGGGYSIGGATGLANTVDGFDGNDLIRQSGEQVVVVVIQYRLGLFGFLAGQKVKEGGALNAGLLDQQFALQWVQNHISKFGGDPHRVTIWGESAGAGSVIQHLVANGGKTNPPLFSTAMTSSTFMPSQYNYNDTIPEAIFNEVISQSNCLSASDALDCLRESDLSVLQSANLNIQAAGFYGTFTFVPVVDGDFIADRPTQLLKEGKLNSHAPVLSVTNAHEGDVFVNQTSDLSLAGYVAQLFPTLESNQIQAAVAQYAGLGSNITQLNAVMGESIIICPSYTLMKAVGGNAFKGEFAIPPALHGTDLPYYFPSGGAPPYQNQYFINAFSESFMNFAVFSNPNVKWNPSDITPTWNYWAGSNEMIFNNTLQGIPDIKPHKTSTTLLERCQFWENLSAGIGQ